MTARRIDSPLGPMLATARATGIAALRFAGDGESICTLRVDNPYLDQLQRELGEYFAGVRQRFDVALSPEGSTFDHSAWAYLRTIPFGQTRSYGRQAVTIGRPTASRAVGGANGRNPIAIVVPCHRVIGVNRSLTGFAGGLDRKRWLLDHEQSHCPAGPEIILPVGELFPHTHENAHARQT